jgi:pantetheine-phosphate adenylyltransferase
MRTAIYPGSFDPVTNGHLDLVQRAAKLFDRVIVAVAVNDGKKPLFTLAERMEMVRASLKAYPKTEVDSFDGLLVDYVE